LILNCIVYDYLFLIPLKKNLFHTATLLLMKTKLFAVKFKLIFFLTVLSLISCNPLKKIASKNPDAIIKGYTAPGFENVRNVFIENFILRNEKGAALTVYYKDTIVVNLYGGYKNKKKELWDDETLVLIFSASKGITALTVAVAVSDGMFSYDDKISDLWSDVACNGKENITIEQMLSHQSGIPLFDKNIKIKHINDSLLIKKLLINQKPFWIPGTKQGYHLYSSGLYLNECIRHADPLQRELHQYFNQRIAQTAGIEFYFGLPDNVDKNRVAQVISIASINNIFRFWQLPPEVRRKIYNPFSTLNKTFRILIGFNPNSPKFLKTRLPSVNGVGKVRDVAKLYWYFSKDAQIFNLKPEVKNYLTSSPHIMPKGNKDEVLSIPMFYKAGLRKPSAYFNFGTSETAFGMSGAGGSFAFADPDIALGYCYAPRLMKGFAQNDPRETALRKAVYDCIKKLETH